MTEVDEARWAKWDDLRARKAAATTDEEREVLAQEEEALSEQGTIELLAQDMSMPKQWMWLSFVDETGFLGVAMVEAGGVLEAAMVAKQHGCNPGGEVQCYPLLVPPDEKYQYRLLSTDELKEAGFV